MEPLERLRELTPILPKFPGAVAVDVGFKQHAMDCGTSFSWDLLSLPKISVAKWFNSSGTRFPEHAHDQREWLIA